MCRRERVCVEEIHMCRLPCIPDVSVPYRGHRVGLGAEGIGIAYGHQGGEYEGCQGRNRILAAPHTLTIWNRSLLDTKSILALALLPCFRARIEIETALEQGLKSKPTLSPRVSASLLLRPQTTPTTDKPTLNPKPKNKQALTHTPKP